jgi:F-type H+-transporting ATPase subunit a
MDFDFKAALEHHILDHPLRKMFMLGDIPVNLTKHLVTMWIVSGLLIALFLFLRYGAAGLTRRLRLLVEAIVLYVRDEVVLPTLGEAGRQYLHYFLTLFFFILACNLIGMIPGMSTATGNFTVTATLSICTFILIHFAGIREQGFVHYAKSIVPSGVPGWLLPIIVPIELIGFFTKTFSLAIRLFMNMIAGHIVILAFVGIIFILAGLSPVMGWSAAPFSVGLALFVYLLELLIVVPLQAFIFTFLTALFVGQAVRPEH